MKSPPFALIAPKHETCAREEAQKQNINTYYARIRRNTYYEIRINTFLRRDKVHFDLKFFHENKTTPLLHPISVYAFSKKIHALRNFHHS